MSGDRLSAGATKAGQRYLLYDYLQVAGGAERLSLELA